MHACMRTGAVEDLRSDPRRAAHDLAERRVLEVGQPRPERVRMRLEKGSKARGTREKESMERSKNQTEI